MMNSMDVIDLGIIEYCRADFLQREILRLRIKNEIPDTLILLEHTPVITVSRRSNRKNILAGEDELLKYGIKLAHTDRGGDVAYHGPGQLVAWPIFDLKNHGRDIHLFLRNLEKVIIDALGEFGVNAARSEGFRGVWVGTRKISSIGVGIKHWVSYHGVSLNIDVNHKHLSCIIPCGLKGKQQVSLSQISRCAPSMALAKEVLVEKFSDTFNLNAVGAGKALVA
ncbi:MAG: lipoyl(octanoyl) transferase LipB [Candidatus Omnitrophota bacterium]